MEITRIFEFDAGHRLPNHKSQCRHVHGHRYKLELVLEGNVLENSGKSEEGMVLDFSDVKVLAKDFLDTLDHAFLVAEGDSEMLNFLISVDSKHVVLPGIPTVENIVQFIGENLGEIFADTYNDSLKIKSLRLWETPNCSAIWRSK